MSRRGSTRRNWVGEEAEYYDGNPDKKEILKQRKHRKEKRLSSALRSRDIDFLLNSDNEEDSNEIV